MDWGTLPATISGAVIAICGTVLADRLRTRHDDDRGLQWRRREAYIEFITAAGAAPSSASSPRTPASALTSRPRAAPRLLMRVSTRYASGCSGASPAVAGAGQAMFERLRGLRRTVAAGALSSPAFHDAYHPYIEAVWACRIAVRGELQEGSPSRERCPLCRPDLVGTADPQPSVI